MILSHLPHLSRKPSWRSGGALDRGRDHTGTEGQLAHQANVPVVMYAGLKGLLRDKVIFHPLLLVALPGSGGIF